MMKNFNKIIAIISIFVLSVAIYQYDSNLNKVNASESNAFVESIFPQKHDINIDKVKKINTDRFEEKGQLAPHEPEKQLAEQVTFGEDVYVNIMEEENFSDWIAVAKKYDAGLYAIPYTDVFSIIKEETPMVHISTGAASALVENANILTDLLKNDDNFSGITEDIQSVIDTGEEISVEVADYEGYYIYEEDGWIFVLW